VPVDCLSAAAVLPLELVLRIAAMLPSNEPRWKKYFASLQSDCQFAPPASESQLIDVEQALGCGLPMLLREFLLEADGAGVSRYNFPIIWSSAEIQKQNREFRTYAGFRELYMPFDHLLFFAADGGGDQFAYAIQADGKTSRARGVPLGARNGRPFLVREQPVAVPGKAIEDGRGPRLLDRVLHWKLAMTREPKVSKSRTCKPEVPKPETTRDSPAAADRCDCEATSHPQSGVIRNRLGRSL
jgi:hypothetical protein